MNDNSLSKKMYVSTILNYGFRGIGILLGLVTVRINLFYLGSSLYGLWVTMAEIASWINYGDFGISNGLRNRLSEAIADNNEDKQKKLIATAVLVLLKISVFLMIILLAVTEALFFFGIMDSSLRIPMYITDFFFCFNLVLGIGRSIAYSYQMSWLASLAQTSTVLLRIIGVFVLIILNSSPSLILFSVVNGLGGVFGNIIVILILIKRIGINYKKKWSDYYDDKLKKSVMGLGMNFFILQLCGVVLYLSDNLIINRLFSSEAVTKYSIITKVYSTGNSLYSILLVSLWSAVSYAAAKGNYQWIKHELKRLICIWGGYSVGVVAVSLFFNDIIGIWLGKEAIFYESPLIFLFAFFEIATGFGSIFVNITNGLGRIKMQICFSVVEAIVNIPLSIFLAKNCNLGIFGIKLATLFCCVGANVFIPIDILLFLKKQKE